MIAPQPMRDAFVERVTRQHGAPSTGPWDRNQGTFHITKVHLRITLIMWNGLPLNVRLPHRKTFAAYLEREYATMEANLKAALEEL